MHRRWLVSPLVVALLFGLAACHNKKVQNPIADVNSKQPDKVLFDRAMEAMKHNRFEVARMSLQTLINAYPDSEYVARAKLAIGDSWYAEGGSASLAQAEAEYKDFKTFFPNMAEAAEAQMKIASIEYQQMEKPDRDFTHAKRAEEEYRQVILEYPDSKLVPEAKERLREVQEVLAEREFRIGRFYYLRESYPAAIARLQSLVDAYPLYSDADEALFLLADSYEKQANMVRSTKLVPDVKNRMLKEFEGHAAEVYARIITRYPVTDRAADARRRLEAMKRPVPKPTPEAIAQNKTEEESRRHTGMWGQMWGNFHKRPDTASVTRVGEPTLADPKVTGAPEIVRNTYNAAAGTKPATGTHAVSVETVGAGSPPPSDAAPRSDAAPASAPGDSSNSTGIPELTPANPPANSNSAPAAGKPDPAKDGPAPAPPQVNDAPQPAPPQVNDAAQTNGGGTTVASSDPAGNDPQASQGSDSSQSSSKQKKKKGLRRIVPF